MADAPEWKDVPCPTGCIKIAFYEQETKKLLAIGVYRASAAEMPFLPAEDDPRCVWMWEAEDVPIADRPWQLTGWRRRGEAWVNLDGKEHVDPSGSAMP